MMTPFFTRLKFAFRTFFAILFRDHIPQDVAAALLRSTPPAAPPATAEATASRAADPVTAPGPDTDATAVQVLALLQRDGRLLDFLMEDISPYADAQIGAAVRTVHAGCRQALNEYVVLGPALDAQEGARVTVDEGTGATRVKVLGNLAGPPPFSGVVRHRGWVITRMHLPSLPVVDPSIVAPAEVEVG